MPDFSNAIGVHYWGVQMPTANLKARASSGALKVT